jgi:VanZ family protein
VACHTLLAFYPYDHLAGGCGCPLACASVFTRRSFGDKAGYFILYGILALLINLALFRSRPDQERIPILLKTGLILSLLIGLEEFSQQFFANRSFDLVDLAFSYLGLVCFSWLALKTKAGRDHPRPA